MALRINLKTPLSWNQSHMTALKRLGSWDQISLINKQDTLCQLSTILQSKITLQSLQILRKSKRVQTEFYLQLPMKLSILTNSKLQPTPLPLIEMPKSTICSKTSPQLWWLTQKCSDTITNSLKDSTCSCTTMNQFKVLKWKSWKETRQSVTTT